MATQHCFICIAGKSADIDAALAAGLSEENAGAKYGFSRQNVRTHKAHSEFKKLKTPETEKPATDNPGTLAEILEQRKRLMAAINFNREEGNYYNQHKFENILQRNFTLESELLAKENKQDTDKAVEIAVRAQISSLVSFLLKQLSAHPEALDTLQKALQSEYGLKQ